MIPRVLQWGFDPLTDIGDITACQHPIGPRKPLLRISGQGRGILSRFRTAGGCPQMALSLVAVGRVESVIQLTVLPEYRKRNRRPCLRCGPLYCHRPLLSQGPYCHTLSRRRCSTYVVTADAYAHPYVDLLT
eukprot:9340536-Pyramimonas_sp.AAC.2